VLVLLAVAVVCVVAWRTSTPSPNAAVPALFSPSAETSFGSFAADKESRLKRLLDKADQHGRASFERFHFQHQGQEGTIEFVHYLELDGTRAGLGLIQAEIGWKVRYALRAGAWQYVSSERQVWDMLGQYQGWVQGDHSRNETDVEILHILSDK
jgi:hypothetical protein